jgi:hypothetical protein
MSTSYDTKQALHRSFTTPQRSPTTPRRSPRRKKKDLPVAKEKEKQKKQSLRRSSRTPRRSPRKKDPPPPPPQRENRVTATIHHNKKYSKKKSNDVSKSWNFIIPPPKAMATQSLTAAQRTTLENFGLQKGMIRRATDLYFWWSSNLVASEKRLNKWKVSENKMRKSMPISHQLCYEDN